MQSCRRFHSPAAIFHFSGILLSLLLFIDTAAVFAHAGHGNEFHQSGGDAAQIPDAISVDAETSKRIGIKVEPVKAQRLSVGIKTTGQIETLPNQKVEVRAPVSGTVVELLVKPGDKVSKGEALLVLSSSELGQLRVESIAKRAEAEGDLQQAQANFKLAQENYDRQVQISAAEIAQAQTQLTAATQQYEGEQDLVNNRSVVKVAKENYQRQVEISQAEIVRAETELSVAKEQFERDKELVAAGAIARRTMLESPEKPLMSILNDSSVFATGNIYEKDLNQVKNGQEVRIKIASLPNRTFTGKISLIGSAVTGETRTVAVKAQLDNAEAVLKPGMFAELEILTDKTLTNILAIPNSAAVEANGKHLVYVKNGDAFQAVEVEICQNYGVGRIESIEGLKQSAIVARNGTPVLLSQVADVKIGAALKRGDSILNGKKAIIVIVNKQPAADTPTVTRAVEAAMEEIKPSLPKDVKVTVTFRLILAGLSRIGWMRF